MKRRDALKNIGLAAGFAIITPSIFSMLQGCTSDTETWIPSYLTTEEKRIVTSLADIFIPKTITSPSATEVNVPQFIDKYIHEILDNKDQEITRTAFVKVIAILKPDTTSSLEDVTVEQYKALLDNHMLLRGEIDEERNTDPEALIMTTSEFLNQLKWMTINAYKNSEEVGENILVYDPVPTAYYCGDLQELTDGKLYSL
tara:strand:+ start:42472 stop:43071 length:600 start_codon:yes stop_codon:yes gene_type:complete